MPLILSLAGSVMVFHTPCISTALISMDFSASYDGWCNSFLPTERTFLCSLFRISFISFSVPRHSDFWTWFRHVLLNDFCKKVKFFCPRHEGLYEELRNSADRLEWCLGCRLQPRHHSSLTALNLQPTANQERNDQCSN